MTMRGSFLEELLADQRSVTAVEQFSRAHEEQSFGPAARYRNLIPLEAPRPGEQYAFEVELDKCSGCKACVTACHSLNGLDDNETWREVGLLIEPKRRRREPGATHPTVPVSSTGGARPASQHITTACHHCVDPACLNGCPVLAYDKDPVTGIVRHLDDQCIGCQYCVLKCPYDVPKYNSRLGIVRKCDMCANRLAANEAPACVQACPNEAIRITKVSTSGVAIEFRERQQMFVPGAPRGDYTLPTTRYRSENLSLRTPAPVAADATTLRPQPAHWPLVLMLVLSQAAVGLCSAAALDRMETVLLPVSVALGVTSIAASVFHLGRPLGAWRFFLNLKQSWLSREILMFSAFVPMSALALFIGPNWKPLLLAATAIAGLAGVFCSMMIYHDTRRTLWHARRSAFAFFGTTISLGAAAVFALNVTNGHALALTIAALGAKLLLEINIVRHVVERDLTPLGRTALLVTGLSQDTAFARVLCAASGLGCALLMHVGAIPLPWTGLSWIPFTFVLAGEVLERLLFFRAVDAPKMPGLPSA